MVQTTEDRAGASVVKVRPLFPKHAQASRLSAYLQPIIGFIAALLLLIAALGFFITRQVIARRNRRGT